MGLPCQYPRVVYGSTVGSQHVNLVYQAHCYILPLTLLQALRS